MKIIVPILLAACFSAVVAEEQPREVPITALEGRNIDGMPAINHTDPITDQPVDPKVGTYCIILDLTDPKGPVDDLGQTPHVVSIGFSSPASLDAYTRIDRSEQERIAMEVVRNRVERQLHLDPEPR